MGLFVFGLGYAGIQHPALAAGFTPILLLAFGVVPVLDDVETLTIGTPVSNDLLNHTDNFRPSFVIQPLPKCEGCGGLHDLSNIYPWSRDGLTDTAWDWLDDINTEGGTGYAGHNDWRIPNVRELQSIVDYGRFEPSLDPILRPTSGGYYWSSSTIASLPSAAWVVGFGAGGVTGVFKVDTSFVRAVRGGR